MNPERQQSCKGWLYGLLFLAFACEAQGQEAIRLSLAGAEAAAARRRAAATLEDSNLRLGPTLWKFGARLGTEANDNIRLESGQPKSDVIFRPEAEVRLLWRASDRNRVDLALGAGYSAYVQHSEYNRVYVTPGSELSYDVYAGDFWLNLHDRFSILEDNYQDPTVVGVADYARLENAAGLTVTWDLNQLIVQAGFDHVNYAGLDTSEDSGQGEDGAAEVFAASAGCVIQPEFFVGLESGGSLNHLSSGRQTRFFTDATEWNLGGFCQARMSEHIRLKVNGGYTVFAPELRDASQTGDDFSGGYARLALTHRLNQFVEYTLSGGRSIRFTFFGGAVDLADARLAFAWTVFRKTRLATFFQYEHGAYLVAGMETFDRVGPGLKLERPFTQHLSASAGYQYYWRGSNVAAGNYDLNLLTFHVYYQF